MGRQLIQYETLYCPPSYVEWDRMTQIFFFLNYNEAKYPLAPTCGNKGTLCIYDCLFLHIFECVLVHMLPKGEPYKGNVNIEWTSCTMCS